MRNDSFHWLRVVKRALFRRVKYFGKSMQYCLYWRFPIDSHKIVITSYYGKGYGDNAKYIVEQLRNDFADKHFDIVWLVNDLGVEMPDGIRKVLYGSKDAIYEEATARVWIDNARKLPYVRKRKGQFYIQTWHGDIGFKKIERDAGAALSKDYIRGAKNDSVMADLFVSGNEWMSEKYKTSFWYNGPIAKCGYPRRDIMYTDNAPVQQIREKLNISRSAKVFLYAPTFRNCAGTPDLSVYNIDWAGVNAALAKRFGGEWVGLVRLHPNISQYSEKLRIPEIVRDVTNYPDIQELLVISDVCISDYSSSVFEFAVTRKPAFLFATDIAEYKMDRGFAYSFEEIPFTVAQSNEELIAHILNFDVQAYNDKWNCFYQDLLGMYEEGHASKYIADVINSKCFE